MGWKRLACVGVGAGMLWGCSGTQHRDHDASAHQAHDAYVEAINSNNLENFLGMITDDIVFMAPNAPIMVGKDTVREWAAGYLDAYTVHWDKTELEFVVNGDWAFEQYAYEENDTPKNGGPNLRDTGKGLIIYRRCDDGIWRVARDAWNSDLPAGGN
ncbi:MAG: nuclear transport factor 2 family protein [Phycisphaerales bacterium]|nr:nuclear transport factor 2 family protein [Phycisphaerales bacterium]